MSTKVGIITEGVVDDLLLAALLERIARDRAHFNWPVMPDDLGEIIPLRKRGHGGVVEAARRIVIYLEQHPPTDHAFFVVLLDRRTRLEQAEVRKLIRGKPLFVLGIAIEEIEAWWLADRDSTLRWLDLSDRSDSNCRYWSKRYNAERDDDPKLTLDELTDLSPRLDQRYGYGNRQLAEDFAELWQNSARLSAIEQQCPKDSSLFAGRSLSRSTAKGPGVAASPSFFAILRRISDEV